MHHVISTKSNLTILCDLQELIEKRQKLMEDFNALIAEKEKLFASMKERRLQLRGGEHKQNVETFLYQYTSTSIYISIIFTFLSSCFKIIMPPKKSLDKKQVFVNVEFARFMIHFANLKTTSMVLYFFKVK